ncbi:MAG TPA: DMT family transporter [Candidatus Saccharimonadales bacterium]|nr:DMT family transporter [Candidatus Saccharimonadales bacterium]
MKNIKYGSAALILAALLFSVDGLLRRHLFTLPPSVIVLYEHLFGALILAPFALNSLKAFKKLSRKQWYAITGVAFLSGAVGTILYTAALGRINFIDFSVVVLLQQLNPVFAITASALLLGEPLTKKFTGLAVVSLIAAYFVTFPELTVNLSTGAGTLIAALYAVGAAAAWGSSTAFSKYALKGTSTLHITAARFTITPLFAFIFVLLSGSAGSIGSITLSQFKYLVAITFSTGMVALLIYYFGLKRVLASRAALLELAWPLSAVIVGYLWLDQGFTFTQGIGAIVLTGAIYLIAQDAAKTKTTKRNKSGRAQKSLSAA